MFSVSISGIARKPSSTARRSAASVSTDWQLIEGTFNSGENTSATFKLVGSGLNTGSNPTGINDELWFDNISIEKVGGEDPIPNNNITGGQNSVSEGISGLAFRFQINGSGAQIEDTNAYINGSAQVKLYKDRDDLYKLVKAGAVMTNNMTIGKGDMTLANVDGKKTIDVNAERLYDLEGTYAQFAVRITNIPLHHDQTPIYARPYYVYLFNGEEVVVYGDVYSQSYTPQDSNDVTMDW